MVEATAVWTDNERFIGQATSGHALVMDAAKDKTANCPMELVLIALCGCTVADVNGILRKKREPFTILEVHAQGRTRYRLSRRLYRDQAHLPRGREGFA